MPIITKDNLNHYGLEVYIRYGFPFDRDLKNEDPDFQFMCFCVTPVHSMSFIFIVCQYSYMKQFQYF